MSNQNYAQVPDLVATQQLNWVTDAIVALLAKGVPFDTDNKRLSDTGVRAIASISIPGRWLGEGGMGMGLPVTFNMVAPSQPYQVLIAKDDSRNDPLLLAFMDEDMEGNPITVLRGGAMIIRPSQENIPVPPDSMEPPPTSGFWMKLV